MTDSVGNGHTSATEMYHATFDPNSESASDVVVSTLWEMTGTVPDELEPIGSVVDPIILDALVRRQRRPIQISFVYNEHDVTVDSGGEIRIQNSRGESRSEFAFTFDADESPTRGVIRAIAAVKGVEPTDVDQLYDFIDPNALDAMFDDETGAGERDLRVSFRFDDLEIEVAADRRVTVRSATAVE